MSTYQAGDIRLNEKYYDCDCDWGYVKHKAVVQCPRCGASNDCDHPDSRADEVESTAELYQFDMTVHLSRLFDIKANSPEEAQLIANTVLEHFVEQLKGAKMETGHLINDDWVWIDSDEPDFLGEPDDPAAGEWAATCDWIDDQVVMLEVSE